MFLVWHLTTWVTPESDCVDLQKPDKLQLFLDNNLIERLNNQHRFKSWNIRRELTLQFLSYVVEKVSENPMMTWFKRSERQFLWSNWTPSLGHKIQLVGRTDYSTRTPDEKMGLIFAGVTDNLCWFYSVQEARFVLWVTEFPNGQIS